MIRLAPAALLLSFVAAVAWAAPDSGTIRVAIVESARSVELSGDLVVIETSNCAACVQRSWRAEAVRAVVACGHQHFRLNRIEAWTVPGNPASDRVLQKTGFRHEGTLRQRAWFKGAFHDFRMFGRIAGDPAE